MLVGIMKNNVMYLIYECNSDMFVSMFCVNTSRPELHCDGQCQLSQMAKEQNEHAASDFFRSLYTEVFYPSPDASDLVNQDLPEVLSSRAKIGYRAPHYTSADILKQTQPPEIS